MSSMANVCQREIRVQGPLLRIASLEADKFQFLDEPDAMIEGLKTCGMRIDLFTFIQRLSELWKTYPYPAERDNLAVLPISTFADWWHKQIRTSARNRARLAEKKGVVVREVPFDDTLVKGICEVYSECPVRQGVPFRHYGKDANTVRREEATFLDASFFIGAFLENKLIGFVKLVHDETRTQAGVMKIVSMIGQRDKAPTNALLAQAVRSCAERGISRLVYGKFAYGKKQQSSLSDFKECNGFKKVDLNRYYVPLTSLGRAALHWGLYRNVVDHIPDSFANKFRKLREAWYSRKFETLKQAS
jgi:hypothetical protein